MPETDDFIFIARYITDGHGRLMGEPVLYHEGRVGWHDPASRSRLDVHVASGGAGEKRRAEIEAPDGTPPPGPHPLSPGGSASRYLARPVGAHPPMSMPGTK